MLNRWSEKDAAKAVEQYGGKWGNDLALRTYSSRLLGLEQDLVLYGGGNASVKRTLTDIFGESIPAIFVKASGFDMASIQPDDFVALDLEYLKKLRNLQSLSDEAMADEFRLHRVRPQNILPSIETLLHAFIPKKFIDHTHPAAILALTNRVGGEKTVREALGSGVTVVPYVKAGFDLAKAVAQAFQADRNAKAIVLLNHGLITCADTAQGSYETTIELVSAAENYIKKKTSHPITVRSPVCVEHAVGRYLKIAPLLRGMLAQHSGDADNPFNRIILKPLLSEEILRILDSENGKELATSAPLTPDYLIRTKAYPLWIDNPNFDNAQALRDQLAQAISTYSSKYEAYVKRHTGHAHSQIDGFDPLPRVVLVPGLGAICTGKDNAGASMVRDITQQALLTKAAIYESGGKYQGLSEDHLFDMEYCCFQRAKLEKSDSRPLAGAVALVTGAAGAIGSGICQALLEEGCAVAASDLGGEGLAALASQMETLHPGRFRSVELDVTDPVSVARGFDAAVEEWGGIDLVVVNAGIALVSPLTQMNIESFRKLERVNVEGALLVLGEAARLFKIQNTGGDIVLISTKNVFAPGAKFGAYSATKAAAHQLARVASLELAEIGVRVNMVAPDAVFAHGSKKSGLWAEVGPERMRARGLDEHGLEEYYRQRNLLKAKITAEHVAKAVLFFATHQTPTTGATIPVDGGLPDATPR